MRMSIEQIKKNVETYYQVTLPSKSRKQHIQDAKRMFSYVAVEQGYSHQQVADTLECDRTNIYNNITRLEGNIQFHEPTKVAYQSVINSDMKDYIDVGEVKLKNECHFTWEANEIRNELLRLKKFKVNDALRTLQWVNDNEHLDIPIRLLNVLAGLNQDEVNRVQEFAEDVLNRLEINSKGTKKYSTFGSNISDFVF